MEASVAGMAPAAVEQTEAPQAQVQAPAPTVEPTTEAATTEGPGGEEGLESAFKSMKASFDQFVESQKPAEETPLATDLLTHLEGQEAEEPAAEADPEGQAAPEQTTELQNPEAQRQLAEAEAFIDSRIQQAITPYQRELAARDMKALGDRYPDIHSKEVLPALTEQINRMVAITGNPDLIYNADLVEQLYKVVKAESADAAAVPAEQAATQGASLETHAGQTQTGDPSLSEKYISEVYKAPAPSAFG